MSTSEDTEWLSFRGASEEHAATFVQTLNRKAFKAGKARDDEWLAQFAAACFSDDALVWYYSLGEEVQNSWKKLCPALLKEFSIKPTAAKLADIESDIISAAAAPGSTPSLAPTPAAAPAPAAPAAASPPTPASAASKPPSPSHSRQPSQQSSTARVGYIELVDAQRGNRLGYISKSNKTITQDRDDVLLLELPPAANRTTPVSLRIIDASFNDGQKRYAGFIGFKSPMAWWMMAVCGAINTGSSVSNVWTVHPMAELLELKLLYPGQYGSEGPQRLYFGQYPLIDSLAINVFKMNATASTEEVMCAYRKADTGALNGFRKVHMIFRPTQ